MANPRLPGISETEETLLYAKLNEYNRGRISFKEAGAYLIVLPRSGHSNYSLWVYSPEPEKQSILFIHDLSPDIYEALRMASTMFYFSKRCLLIVDYNLKRMQSNGDDLIPFGKYRGHYLHEILKVDPAYLSWIAYKYTPKIPKQERFVEIAKVYHSVHLDLMQRKARQKQEAGRSHFESSQSKDRRRSVQNPGERNHRIVLCPANRNIGRSVSKPGSHPVYKQKPKPRIVSSASYRTRIQSE